MGSIAVSMSSLLSLRMPSPADKSLVKVVRASVHAALPMAMNALSEP